MAHPLISLAQQLDPSATLTYSPPRIVSSSGATYYAKLGSPREQQQYTAEIESLNAIHDAAPGLAPRVLLSGTLEETNQPYMISEYKHLSSLTSASAHRLAIRLATELHRHKSDKGFGFDVPTFCGPTKQANGWYPTWKECFDKLLGGLLDGLRARGYDEVCAKGEKVREVVIPYLLDPLKVEPVLLHGDLWSGNTGTDTATGEPVIFDPSSYYGHNEADLAIARIFGGFSSSFFSTYHEHLPKSEPVEHYELRVDLYELYHYLNHALIFGGSGYSSSALKKMNRLLKYCSK